MIEQYDSAVASHYAAYRPALHTVCLERMMGPGESFELGLDIGCGTGYSTVALAKYCKRVIGLDPSQAMLDRAQRHSRIEYVCGSGDALGELQLSGVDVVTFAGALFYTKTDKLRSGLRSVLSPGGLVLVYDFEVLLADVMKLVGVNRPAVASGYDHAANLSDWQEFSCLDQRVETVALEATAEQLAHILLSDSNRYVAFSERFRAKDPFQHLAQYISGLDRKIPLCADIYFSKYRAA